MKGKSEIAEFRRRLTLAIKCRPEMSSKLQPCADVLSWVLEERLPETVQELFDSLFRFELSEFDEQNDTGIE